FFSGEIWREENKQNLQIRHVAALTTRIIQGVEPWVSHRPLAKEDGEYIVKIPPGGVLRTSSAEEYGWARDHYYYYSAQGMHPLGDSGPGALIWGKINGEGFGASGKRKYEELFVGTAQQFKNQVPMN
ncbi:MAG: hypothetical protein WA741_00880, partial [Candidatus Sulfotelmatobacter sp.]